LHYSHQFENISKSLSTIGTKKQKYSFFITHAFAKTDNEVTSNYYQYKASIMPNIKHQITGTYSYDVLNDIERGYGLGYFYKKKCWDFYIKFNRVIKPYLSNGYVNSKINDIIYLQVNLNPLWGFKQKIYEEEL
jgi:LPS-assembly protein